MRLATTETAIGHEFTTVHDVLDTQPRSRAFRDGLAQHVAGR
jgi:hypothetical protein